MGKAKTSDQIINKMVYLRKRGHSISEISNILNKSKSVVSRYIKDVDVLPEFENILKRKQGGSIARSEDLWAKSKILANKMMGSLSKRDKMVLLVGIYWGEGTKKELNIINGDAILLKSFIYLIEDLGISKDRIRASIRIYNNISYQKALLYWSSVLKLNKNNFYKPEIIKNHDSIGKFEFGMCRLRVEKSSKEFKILVSLINCVKEQIMLL